MNPFKTAALLAVALSAASCSAVKHVTIYCEPQRAAIHVDDIYRGNGIVRYEVPRAQKWITVSCSEDGIRFASRRLRIKGAHTTVSFRLDEYMRYSSGDQPRLSTR